jgi:hypothetical protein
LKKFQGNAYFSEPAAENLALCWSLEGKDELLALIRSTPAALQSLLNELDQPPDNINLPGGGNRRPG